MIEMRVDLSPALSRLLGQSEALVRRAGVLASKRAAEAYVDAIHEWIGAGRSFRPRTGALEQSIGWHAVGDGAVVYSNAPHAPHVELGTGLWGPKRRKYPIAPKPGRKALRFFAADGGRVMRRSVLHPGIRPRPFFFADQQARHARLLGAAREAVAEVLGGGHA